MEYKCGDVVRFKGSDLEMTVREFQKSGIAICDWRNDESDFFQYNFNADALELVRSKQ